MPWTTGQKRHAITLCRRAGLDDDARKLILRQIPNARFDSAGQPTEDGEPTMTSAKLTNRDFDTFKRMVTGNDVDPCVRERHLVKKIAAALEAATGDDGRPLLEPNGVEGWIDKRVHAGARLDNLTSRELYGLIEALKAYAKRHGVKA